MSKASPGMLAHMDDLPSEFAVEIGRIVYHSSHADFLLNRLLAVQEGAPEGKGLSGGQLLLQLKPLAIELPVLADVVDGYESMYEWRNRLVHGAHTYSNNTLWTWHVSIRGKGNSAQSYQLGIENLRTMADGWQNLGTVAHLLLHEVESSNQE